MSDPSATGAVTGPTPILEEVIAAPKKRLGLGAWLAIAWLALMIGFAVIGPMLGLDTASSSKNKNKPPFSDGHLLGFDGSGRDMLNQLILGTRASMFVSFGAVVFGTAIGGFLGLVAGYFKNRFTSVLGSLFDILLAYPPLVLALTLVTVLASQPDVSDFRRQLVVLLGIGIVSVPILARITRANTLMWSEREFVLAARAMGAKRWRILLRDVLPNVVPAMLAIALLGVAVAIVAEGGLSLLGVGVKGVSWGNIINTGRNEFRRAPHIIFAPVTMLFLTVMALNYLGDVVRRRFDVREGLL